MPKHKHVALMLFVMVSLAVAVDVIMALMLARLHKPSYTYLAGLGGGLTATAFGYAVATLAWLGKLPACKPAQ
jgi:hypothetical protein